MTDFLCPTCGPIDEDDGLLTGPGDAVCCAFCGCPEEDMTPLREAYEALVRETSSPVTGYRKLLQQLSDRARDNAVQQAKIWAQEARTQRAIVMEIGELVGCENDWEMVGAVREALAPAAAPKGYALVPETPTFEMYEAGEHALFGAVSTMNSGSCYIAMLRAAPAAPTQQVQGEATLWAESIPEVIQENGGWWQTCSGCYNSEDGHAVGEYPASKMMGCTLGAGCSECGGIGAIWYHESDAPPAPAAVPEPAIDALEFYADKSRYSSSWEARHNHHVMEDKGEVARVALERITAAPAPAEPEDVDEQQASLFRAHNGAED